LALSGCHLDRNFLDRLSDHLFVFNGNGKIKDFVGNYFDYKEMQNFENAEEKKAEKAIRKVNAPVKTISEKSRKISFKEQKEYEKLEIAITQLEQEKENLIEQMNSGTLSTDEMHKVSMRFEGLSKELDETEMRWLELSEKDQ
jgi:ATP-binding cassette subfamily F protein uup